MTRLRHRWRARWRDDRGQVSAFAALLAVALIAVAGLVLDAGLALANKVEALDIAQSAARAGAQQLDLATYRTTSIARLHPPRAVAAARAWLATAAVTGTVTATTTTITVTVRRTTDTQLLRITGVQTLTVTATATATAVHGVSGPGT